MWSSSPLAKTRFKICPLPAFLPTTALFLHSNNQQISDALGTIPPPPHFKFAAYACLRSRLKIFCRPSCGEKTIFNYLILSTLDTGKDWLLPLRLRWRFSPQLSKSSIDHIKLHKTLLLFRYVGNFYREIFHEEQMESNSLWLWSQSPFMSLIRHVYTSYLI